jgi:hypothetical protein
MFRQVITAISGSVTTIYKGRTEVGASTLQLKFKPIITLLYQKWDNKAYSSKAVKRCSVPEHKVCVVGLFCVTVFRA